MNEAFTLADGFNYLRYSRPRTLSAHALLSAPSTKISFLSFSCFSHRRAVNRVRFHCVGHNAPSAFGLRRYSASTFRTSHFPASFEEQTIPSVADTRLSARRPTLRDKSCHPRSHVIDIDILPAFTDTGDTSLYPFSVSPVLYFPRCRRGGFHVDIVPQDICSRPAGTSAPPNGNWSFARLLVRIDEHPVHGRETH